MGGIMEQPFWARKLHNLLLFVEDARTPKDRIDALQATAGVLREVLRDEFGLRSPVREPEMFIAEQF
mgnify:CR=1 FL=1